MSDDIKDTVGRQVTKATFLQTLVAVLCSFFGVRRGNDHESDMERLNPIHVILVAVLAAALFVWGLIALVHFVVAQS